LFSAGHVMLRRAVRGAPQSHMKYTRRRAIRLQGQSGAVRNPAGDCIAPTALG
jgi:hypothetical protein